MKRTAGYLATLSLCLFTLQGCRAGGPEDGSRPPFLHIQMISLPRVPVARVFGAEILLAPAGAEALPLQPGSAFFDIDGVPVALRTQDEDGDGRLELLVTFGSNPFRGGSRNADVFLYPQLAPGADGGAGGPIVSPALVARARLFTRDENGNTVLMAAGEATTDVSGQPIRFDVGDRNVQVLVDCLPGAPCDPTVVIPPGRATVTVRRLPSCPTSNLAGNLFVFLLSNPLATTAGDPTTLSGEPRFVDLADPETTQVFTFNKVPPGTYWIFSVLDVGGDLPAGNYIPGRGDLRATLRAVQVLSGQPASAETVLDEVVGVGFCSAAAAGATVRVARLRTCPTTNVDGDLYVALHKNPLDPGTAASALVIRPNVSFQPDTSVTVEIPPVPVGTYLLLAVHDVGRNLPATSFVPAVGDFTAPLQALRIQVGGAGNTATAILDRVVGVGPCHGGIDLSGQVRDSVSQPLPRAPVLAQDQGGTRDTVGVASTTGSFSLQGIEVPYDLTVVPPGSDLVGMVSWAGVDTPAPRASVPVSGGTFRSAILNVTYPMDNLNSEREGEIVVASPLFAGGQQRSGLFIWTTTGDDRRNFPLSWSGPETITVAVAGAQYSRDPTRGSRTGFLDFGVVKLTITSGSTVDFTFPASARFPAGGRQLPITVNATASFTSVNHFAMMEFDGIRFSLPGSSPGGQSTSPIEVAAAAACQAPCSQFLATRGEIVPRQQSTCSGVSVARTPIAAADTAITVNLADPPDITTPAPTPLPDGGLGTPVVDQPVAFAFTSPAALTSHVARLSLASEGGDGGVLHFLWTASPSGRFPDLSSLGIRLPGGFYDLAVMSLPAGFDPRTSLQSGMRVPTFEPCAGAPPVLDHPSGRPTGAAYGNVQVRP
jgi:hypothetical protein